MAADPDVERVYLCEDRLQRWARVGRAVVVDGRLVSVEPEHDFSDLASVRLFCTLTCLELGLPPVRVRLRKGEAKSHYRAAHPPETPDRAEIALASWGAARLVVLHELAHHLAEYHPARNSPRSAVEPAHGPLFRASLVELLRHVALPRQADELQRMFTDAGLPLASTRAHRTREGTA